MSRCRLTRSASRSYSLSMSRTAPCGEGHVFCAGQIQQQVATKSVVVEQAVDVSAQGQTLRIQSAIGIVGRPAGALPNPERTGSGAAGPPHVDLIA